MPRYLSVRGKGDAFRENEALKVVVVCTANGLGDRSSYCEVEFKEQVHRSNVARGSTSVWDEVFPM